jgi:hypothetical protein
MKIASLAITIAALVAGLSACGGGGDDGPDTAHFSGTYAVTLSKTSDSCGAFTAYNGSDHAVSANGSTITVSFNGSTLSGSADNAGGFSATNTTNAGTATATMTVTYAATSEANAYSVNFTGRASSSLTGAVCTVSYAGTAKKR